MHKPKKQGGSVVESCRKRISRAAATFRVEGLESRVCLSSAIAAFAAQQTFAAGANPFSVTVWDVNGDGSQDVVTANIQGNSVSVLLGNGAGGFLAQATFATGSQPISVAAADVNADGKADLVVANLAGSNVSVLLGNGNGTFRAQQTYAAGSHPRQIAIADVNGDGKPDLIVPSAATNTVGVLLGNGNGTFQTVLAAATGAYPHSVAVADVNGDGKADLVVANANANTVSVLLSNGNGTFKPQQTFAFGQSATSVGPWVAVSDVNGDGKLDVMVAAYSSNAVCVLLGNGDGTFQTQMTFAAGAAPVSLAVSDINTDGKRDLVLANFNSSPSTVSVLLGNGDGTFQPQKTFSTGAKPRSVAVADVNGDGHPDVVAANDAASGSVSLLLGDGPPEAVSISRGNPTGKYTSYNSVTFTVTFNEPVTGVDPSDFSLALDHVTTAPPLVVTPVNGAVYNVTVNGIFTVGGSGTLELNLVDDGTIKDPASNPLQGGASGQFLPQQTYGLGTFNEASAVGDVNGDGKPDIVAATGSSGVSVLLGNGDGTFQDRQVFPTSDARNVVVLGDVNGDGYLDIVVANYGYGTVGVLLGNGNGSFKPQQTFVANSLTPGSLALADMNADGKLDVVTVDATQNNSVSILLGNGNGTFKPQVTFGANGFLNAVTVGDFNQDGRPDVAIAYISSIVGIMLGNGNGTLQAAQTFAAGSGPAAITAADLNGDGRLDLSVLNRVGGSISILLGNGNGTFQPQQTFTGSFQMRSEALVDINHDGKPDLVFTAEFGNINVLFGNGNGTFKPARTTEIVGNPRSIVVADLNGDGQSDLVIGDYHNLRSSVLLAPGNGSVIGDTYNIQPNPDTINGTSGVDHITLQQNANHAQIDVIVNSSVSQVMISDPAGLTINGLGSNDVITLDYSNGNPLPKKLNLNSLFTLNGLQATGNPLAGTTIDVKTSTIFITYGGPDPLSLIQGYLKSGFNGGAWTGAATASTGVIRSSSAAANPLEFSVGYADSADAFNPAALPANTIELRYTVIGDTNLDGTVGGADYAAVVQNYNTGTKWDQGNVTYGTKTGGADYAAVVQHYGHSVASPAAVPAAAPTLLADAVQSAGNQSAAKTSLTISVKPTTEEAPPRKAKRHRTH